jgi:hypothetical protein
MPPLADRRFFAGLTALALLGGGMIFGSLVLLDDHYRVEEARGQEARLGESYRTASGEQR